MTAYNLKIPRVFLETDNTHAYEILLDQDPEAIEEEDLEEVVRQIENLSNTYNNTRQDDNSKWVCELVAVHSSQNRAALCMAQYGMTNYSSLVEVPVPFAELQEKLDMDMGFGPHADFLEVLPNFGEGEVVDAVRGRRNAAEVIVLSSEDDEEEG